MRYRLGTIELKANPAALSIAPNIAFSLQPKRAHELEAKGLKQKAAPFMSAPTNAERRTKK
mgnify:FL=1